MKTGRTSCCCRFEGGLVLAFRVDYRKRTDIGRLAVVDLDDDYAAKGTCWCGDIVGCFCGK